MNKGKDSDPIYRYPFNLIVPRSQELKARQLIKGLNIRKLYYYILTKVGIKFRQVSNLRLNII